MRKAGKAMDETEVSHDEDDRVRRMAARWLVQYDERKYDPRAEDSTEAFLIRALFYRWNEADKPKRKRAPKREDER